MQVVRTKYNIAIAGGGPAGAVAAALLARLGYRVALANLPSKQTRIEGLSPRIADVLTTNGIAFDGVSAPSQRRVDWGSFQGDQNVEQIVDRSVFDASLLAQAERDGVDIYRQRVVSILPESGHICLEGGHICLEGGQILHSDLLIEARGRRAPRLRDAGYARDKQIGPNNLSVAGIIPADSKVTLPAGSHIQARPNGWIWRAGLPDGRVWQQIVTDSTAAKSGLKSGARTRVEALWHHAQEGAEAVPLPHHPVVGSAGLRLNAPRLDPRCLRLGDAAVALDPLSGHGMFWAVSSALMMPAMVRAVMNGQTHLAAAFYQNRVIDTFLRQARIGRDFYKESGFDGAFWTRRRSWPDHAPAHPTIGAPRIERRVLCQNGALTQAAVLVTEMDVSGVGFVMGHEIVPILRRIGRRPLPPLADFQTQIVPTLLPQQAEALHGWLTHRGLASRPAQQDYNSDRENAKCDTRPAA